MKILGFNITRTSTKVDPPKKADDAIKSKEAIKTGKSIIAPPGDRSTEPTAGSSGFTLNKLIDKLNIVKPEFQIDAIPLIRKLYKVNEDLGSVLYDAIQLTNTGHNIKFSQDVDPKLADKMREHLKRVSKKWHHGTANIDGLINKWIAQIYVSGALSVEWIPNINLDGIAQNAIINPETIRFALNSNGSYRPLQKRKGLVTTASHNGLKELNPNTYMYLSLFSDDDTPYGVPPFLTALKAIETQGDMKANINHILKQLGLLGYLEVTLDKPMQNANESESKYQSRLEGLLRETKRNMLQGFKDGIVVGYTDDHTFEFHSTTKNLAGVSDIYNMNERQIANGLKTSPSFLGIAGGGTENFMSIVFTKTLSQLRNTQDLLAACLEQGYEMELLLAGFNYPGRLEVEFNRSTITDEVKIQQGREYKQRVLSALHLDGIISSETYAEEMGYQKPYRVMTPEERQAIIQPKNNITKEDADKDTKNKSARKTRETDKSQPKRKDTTVKPT